MTFDENGNMVFFFKNLNLLNRNVQKIGDNYRNFKFCLEGGIEGGITPGIAIDVT